MYLYLFKNTKKATHTNTVIVSNSNLWTTLLTQAKPNGISLRIGKRSDNDLALSPDSATIAREITIMQYILVYDYCEIGFVVLFRTCGTVGVSVDFRRKEIEELDS